MEILALRHGQSEWNAEGRWQGQADPPLTSLGEQQALLAANQLLNSGEIFDTIASSDLQRAQRTAEIIAEIVGDGVVELRTEFRERLAGSWQGLTRSEIETLSPGAIEHQQWPEGYESDESVIGRVMPAIHENERPTFNRCSLWTDSRIGPSFECSPRVNSQPFRPAVSVQPAVIAR